MKSKSLHSNGTGRRLLIEEIARFFDRPWTLEEATVYLQGSKNLIDENEKLLALIRQSKEPDNNNRALEPIQKTPAQKSKTTKTPTASAVKN